MISRRRRSRILVGSEYQTPGEEHPMASMLQQGSNDSAAAVEGVGPAVGRVDARRRFPASGVVWSSEGVIVTTHHVARREEGITVGLADGRIVAATLVARDPSTDLAVLQIGRASCRKEDR